MEPRCWWYYGVPYVTDIILNASSKYALRPLMLVSNITRIDPVYSYVLFSIPVSQDNITISNVWWRAPSFLPLLLLVPFRWIKT